MVYSIVRSSTEPHDGRFHRTLVFCLPTRSVINLLQVRTGIPKPLCCCDRTQALWDHKCFWDSKVLFRKSLCLTALSAVIHCCNTSVEARWGQRGIFYILLIKSQSFGEFVSWNCDFHKCFCRGLVSISWHPPPFQSSAMELWPLWLCVFLSLSETGRLQGIGRGGMLFPWGDKALAQSFP